MKKLINWLTLGSLYDENPHYSFPIMYQQFVFVQTEFMQKRFRINAKKYGRI